MVSKLSTKNPASFIRLGISLFKLHPPTKIGQKISKEWFNLGKKYNLNIKIFGMPATSGFSINSPNALYYKTYITQEMLAKGYLASNLVFACIEHTDEIIDGYLESLDPIFETIQNCENGLNIKSLLMGPVCHSSFKRLN